MSEDVKACAWKAQTRLHKRLRQLLARGKHRNKAQVAVARELVGFVWQIFRLMEGRMKETAPPPAAAVGVRVALDHALPRGRARRAAAAP